MPCSAEPTPFLKVGNIRINPNGIVAIPANTHTGNARSKTQGNAAQESPIAT